MKILIAGVGNVLRHDDGFGVVAAMRLLELKRLPRETVVIETGIAGISLVQELLDGYDGLIVLDCLRQPGRSGRSTLSSQRSTRWIP